MACCSKTYFHAADKFGSVLNNIGQTLDLELDYSKEASILLSVQSPFLKFLEYFFVFAIQMLWKILKLIRTAWVHALSNKLIRPFKDVNEPEFYITFLSVPRIKHTAPLL
jgi:hypothetical protein